MTTYQSQQVNSRVRTCLSSSKLSNACSPSSAPRHPHHYRPELFWALPFAQVATKATLAMFEICGAKETAHKMVSGSAAPLEPPGAGLVLSASLFFILAYFA